MFMIVYAPKTSGNFHVAEKNTHFRSLAGGVPQHDCFYIVLLAKQLRLVYELMYVNSIACGSLIVGVFTRFVFQTIIKETFRFGSEFTYKLQLGMRPNLIIRNC